MIKPLTPVYVCDDVHTVTVLNLHGIPSIGVVAEGPRRFYQFEDSVMLRETLSAYQRGVLTVNARMYALVYRDVVGQLRKTQAASESRQ